MPDHAEIYRRQADQYEQLVSREDYQGHLLPALQQIGAFAGLTVAELGAGTGRLTRLVAPIVKDVNAFDLSRPMLDLARVKLQEGRDTNWRIAVADHRQVPLGDGVADIVLSGWSVCYLVVENDLSWEGELSKALLEMRRIVRPGGALILIETLGTGREEPEAPAGLAAYYAYLQAVGFEHLWVRTDYLFRDNAEADSLTRFFFGDDMVAKIRQNEHGVVLPECTGIWWVRRAPGS
ncbi:MAG TPA: class I SAM-dependent methyltransferase [Anaerolineales bacterium]|nr:class I SAM-dependent methyltransferase [Anaerolineales bacterium]